MRVEYRSLRSYHHRERDNLRHARSRNMVEFLSAIILPKNLSRAPPLLLTSSPTVRTSVRRRGRLGRRRLPVPAGGQWPALAAMARERRGRDALLNICSADLVRGSRRYCGTACARACVYVSMCVYTARAHNLASPILQYILGEPGNDHHAISIFRNLLPSKAQLWTRRLDIYGYRWCDSWWRV